jgi:phosphoglycolate phosphatase
MPYLILFDIDHTLLFEKSAHRMAFHMAMNDVYGTKVSIDDIPHAGMTDQQIIVEVLKLHGIKENNITDKLDICKNRMCEIFFQHVSKDTIEMMPGVKELLFDLQKNGHKTALVTGNLECIAKKKMEVAEISQFFPIGGFGSDSFERKELIKLSITRSEQYYHQRFHNNVILIGDTLRDMIAGREAHIRTIGVATGSTPTEELQKTTAHLVVKNLLEREKIIQLLQ